ncbi:hypothetical protein N2152v2_009925 [Parachlorella kessleri]
MLRFLRRAPQFRARCHDQLATWEPYQGVQQCAGRSESQPTQAAASAPASQPEPLSQQHPQQQGPASLQPMQGRIAARGCTAARCSWPVGALVAGAAPVRQLATGTPASLVRAVEQTKEGSRRKPGGGRGSGNTSGKASAGGTCRDKAGRRSSSSPLLACLARYGISDLPGLRPKHLAFSQEEVSSNVEPKLAALAAEGLGPRQMAKLVGNRSNSVLACSYTKTFLPNLQLLQQITGHTQRDRDSRRPEVTAVGKALSVSIAAMYLIRDPSKVQQLLQWLEGSLCLGMEQLAACNSLCTALHLSADTASAVCLLLQQYQVPAQQVAHMLLRRPELFACKPELVFQRIPALQQHLGLDAEAALQIGVAHPHILACKLEASLPPLLQFLDSYMGEVGAGRRLVLAQPNLAGSTVTALERSIASLAARGCGRLRIQEIINKHPVTLQVDLSSPLQQQKLDWIDRVSPWTLADFLDSPRNYHTTTRRLAGRLALLRTYGLQPPPSPAVLAVYNNARFLGYMNRHLARQERELPWASMAEWEKEWLGTDAGREWGFPPVKD